jgi:hypothetical protein
MNLKVRTSKVEGADVVEVSGEVELHSAPQLRDELQKCWRSGTSLRSSRFITRDVHRLNWSGRAGGRFQTSTRARHAFRSLPAALSAPRVRDYRPNHGFPAAQQRRRGYELVRSFSTRTTWRKCHNTNGSQRACVWRP